MAYHLYPLRPSTVPEKAALALPREEGILKPHHDRWGFGIDLGHRLVSKTPFYVGDYLVGIYEEFVIIDKIKSENRYRFRSLRDPRVVLEGSAEEIDSNFYVIPGDEMTSKRQDIHRLLGKDRPGAITEKPPVAEPANPPKEAW
jgi:hypothetical protein